MLAEEREEVRVYRTLASRRDGEEREILLGLADAEERHVAHWEGLLGGDAGRPRRGTPRMRLLAFLARWLGWVFVLALMQQAESRARRDADVPPAMAADERVHAEVVRGLAARGRTRLSGTLRAAVFGVNDGLVSNIALVLGVIGGGAGTRAVLLTGLSGLLAGALSMAAGEFVSVSSQRELLAASASDETARDLVSELDVDANELALVYRARGMPADEARRHADAVLRRRSVPAAAAPGFEGFDVVGSGAGAALSSFLFFGAGAAVPVLPFLLGLEGAVAVVAAGTLTGAALMLVGGAVGVLSGAPPLRRALRQLAIGAAAAAATYLLGLAFGAAVDAAGR
ncbi:VIT1/CCC1 transporter family protein [Actinorugispora endophytica]|uniref:VIT1/CCC1 family predicted Fe2+/Mn2+ transporter n=1 Tax=Actinorugispora endophytica TaxID=1605990 RepID=A0A4R6V4S3_9ACTN|nr:VIT1/CCC1 family protein [Actinorugispora endophytica]TDQ53287.1 VIT1/CCC1 family predicted Fe2+/Mn2+ transporter [Actinorugispora endophytica]